MTKDELEKLKQEILKADFIDGSGTTKRDRICLGFGFDRAVEVLWPEIERLKEWSNTTGKEQNFQYQRAEALKADLALAVEELGYYQHGYKGGCCACESVGSLNIKLRHALEFYAARPVYEKLSQFPGDECYVECSDIAAIALKEGA